MKKAFVTCFSILCITAILTGCYHNTNVIREIRIGLHNNNQLQIQINVLTNAAVDAYAEYWPQKGDSTDKMRSTISKNASSHQLVICNITPATGYAYHIITVDNGVKKISKTYTFTSHGLPMWMQGEFKAINTFPQLLPQVFKDGLMLVNKNYSPGLAYLVDYKGQIRWYHMVDGMSYKVLKFTKDHTVLALLGRNDEPTSYGSQILEVNLLGDTILNIKKGEGDFKQTIHHEILKNDKAQLVTLTVEKKVMDLSSVGGGKKDTVNSDGIIVLDQHAKLIWKWTVFDVADPLKDPTIAKNKKDWTHANSLAYDKDGNYLISFYNNGQIWKVDSKSGRVLWKFGKGGTIAMPAACDFNQSHAAHINREGDLMFFDNGVQKHLSEVFALKINETNKISSMDLHFKLPPEVFNERMGSAYMINDTSFLCCCSKKHILVLADRKGTLLWTMETAMPSYRAVFVPGTQLSPYLKP